MNLKKYAFSYLAFFLSIISLKAQDVEFPTPGLRFGDVYFCNPVSSCAGSYNNSSFEYLSDTVICNKTFHRFGYISGSYVFSLHAEDGIYSMINFQNPCEQGDILYDFTLEVGDIFTPPGLHPVFYEPDTLTVIEVGDFILDNGESRKKLVLESKFASSETFVWVEGIGDINHGFFRDEDEEGGHEEFICVKDDVGLFHTNPEYDLNCDSILCHKPVAFFDYVCHNDEIYFENLSKNSTEYLWDFGDGIFSEEENPVHVYAEPGCYKVQLTCRTDCMTTEFTNFQILNIEAGYHWQPVFDQDFTALDMFFLDENIGWLGYRDSLHLTTDGGQNWETVILPDYPAYGAKRFLDDLFFYDENNGIAITSTNGSVPSAETANFLWTDDGGHTWQPSNFGAWSDLRNVVMTSPEKGFVSTEFFPDLFKTSDGGQTWEELDNVNLAKTSYFAHIGGDTLYIIGNKWPAPYQQPYVFSWTHDGVNFEKVEISSSDFPEISANSAATRLFFVDAQNGWFITNQRLIFHTTDGGQNWELQFKADVSLHDIEFFSPTHGMAIGWFGTVYETFDAGDNWEVAYCEWEEGFFAYTELSWKKEDRPYILNRGSVKPGLLTLAAPTFNDCMAVSPVFESKSEGRQFSIYPNPTDGDLAIELILEKAEEVSFSVFDLMGKKVAENPVETIQSNEVQIKNIDLGHCPPGVYFLEIKMGEEIFSQKIVKR